MTAQSEWARCKPWIEAALKYTRGTHTIEDIEAGIASGQFHFWAGKSAAAITEIVVYPRLKDLNIFLVGGDRAGMKELYPHISAFAKASGCSRETAGGRRGFERIANSFGFSRRWTLFVKEH